MSTRFCKYSMYRSLVTTISPGHNMDVCLKVELQYSFCVKNTLWGNNLPRVNQLCVIVTTYPSYIYHGV